jgi:hypothetical protein
MNNPITIKNDMVEIDSKKMVVGEKYYFWWGGIENIAVKHADGTIDFYVVKEGN